MLAARGRNPVRPMRFLFATIAAILAGAQSASAATAVLAFDGGVPPVRFAAGEIRRALEAQGTTVAGKGLAEITAASGETRIILVSSSGEGRRIAAALNLAPFDSAD